MAITVGRPLHRQNEQSAEVCCFQDLERAPQVERHPPKGRCRRCGREAEVAVRPESPDLRQRRPRKHAHPTRPDRYVPTHAVSDRPGKRRAILQRRYTHDVAQTERRQDDHGRRRGTHLRTRGKGPPMNVSGALAYPVAVTLTLVLVPRDTPAQQPITPRDGQHDFDFEIGSWKVHNSRLLHPLTGYKTWIEFEGTSVARQVWAGRADLLELESETPNGHAEGLILRLYHPQSHQWSVTFASGTDGSLGQPAVGEFKNGRGEFYGQELVNGKTVLARNVVSDITPSSYRVEFAFSEDGGKTWEVNWISLHTRKGNS